MTATSNTPQRPFLRAAWRDLLMLNFEVPADLVEPLVPAGVGLDRWSGRLYVSVVGFRFVDTRVLGLAVMGHRAFEEVNLRFYVRRTVGDEVRRGVVFVRELVPRRAIALVARLAYNEPYRAVPMRHSIARHVAPAGTMIEYAWKEAAGWTRLAGTISGAARPLVAGSEAEFITEHYWGYTRQRDGGTVEYRVDHPRWNVWNADDPVLEGDLAAAYGEAFARVLVGPPVSAFVADGSPVTVFAPRRIR
jgi:uncharacterized protein YqjF (DUF2071 family)